MVFLAKKIPIITPLHHEINCFALFSLFLPVLAPWFQQACEELQSFLQRILETRKLRNQQVTNLLGYFADT